MKKKRGYGARDRLRKALAPLEVGSRGHNPAGEFSTTRVACRMVTGSCGTGASTSPPSGCGGVINKLFCVCDKPKPGLKPNCPFFVLFYYSRGWRIFNATMISVNSVVLLKADSIRKARRSKLHVCNCVINGRVSTRVAGSMPPRSRNTCLCQGVELEPPPGGSRGFISIISGWDIEAHSQRAY